MDPADPDSFSRSLCFGAGVRVSARAALTLLCVWLAGCTYEPPVYRGKIESTALLGDGRVAIVYSQYVTRAPTGFAAFPDGGRALVLHDERLVALVDPDGSTRELMRVQDSRLVGVTWHEADPHHLYVTRGSPVDSLEIFRLSLRGREVARFNLSRELAEHGRDPSCRLVVDAHGTLLFRTLRNGTPEVWRRDPDGTWTFLDELDDHFQVVGEDVVYLLGSAILARNFRTGKVRTLSYFDPRTQRSVTPDRGDPALARSGYQPTMSAGSNDRKEITIWRDHERIGSISPDLRILDRR